MPLAPPALMIVTGQDTMATGLTEGWNTSLRIAIDPGYNGTGGGPSYFPDEFKHALPCSSS